MTHRRLIVPAFLLLGFVAGCGEETVEVQPPPANAAAKKMLEDMAATGQPMGSGGMVLQEEINRIKSTDPAKAEKLQKQYDSLVSEKNPAKIKSTAKEMSAEL